MGTRSIRRSRVCRHVIAVLKRNHHLPDKALQLTANPLPGLSAAELSRYVFECNKS
jgi:hypothetical protein